MKLFTYLLIILLTSCAHEDGVAQAQVQTWSPSELNKQKSALDGKQVVVRAFVFYDHSSYSLWDDVKSFKSGNPKHCTSVVSSEQINQKMQKEIKKFIVLKGVFHRDVTKPNQVTLGLCNFTGITVAEIVVP